MRLKATGRMMLGLLLAGAGAAGGGSFTGATWAVHFNVPDQTTHWSSIGPDEYIIREAWLARINALQSNDWACLSTFTFSGNTAAAGAAGPILEAMNRALDRGARLGFVADKFINVNSNFWPGLSLSGLAARARNPLELSQAPPGSGIMHHKMGVFWKHQPAQAWVLSGSWNFTGGASSFQWNILTEIQNNALGAASSNEMRELLSGRFHFDPAKSRAHDGARFRLDGTSRDGWVRFAPYPDATYGGNNAHTDIIAAIDSAEEEIVFALNKLTRTGIAEALIRACDRGVRVHGTIPRSDWVAPSAASHEIHAMLADPANYATANRVWLYEAYLTGLRTEPDDGSADLTHTKYLVIDPDGDNALVIHGSANWTDAGLVSDSANDENILFLPHGGIARAFVAQFNAMTDGTVPWCRMGRGATPGTTRLDFWLPYAGPWELVSTDRLLPSASWSAPTMLPQGRGIHTMSPAQDGPVRFYRIQRRE